MNLDDVKRKIWCSFLVRTKTMDEFSNNVEAREARVRKGGPEVFWGDLGSIYVFIVNIVSFHNILYFIVLKYHMCTLKSR
jgi:hypothetical protein